MVLNFFKSNNFISNFIILKKKNDFFFLIKPLYYKNLRIFKRFKNFFKKTRVFSISLKALYLLSKKSGSSSYIVSTSNGILSHQTALNQSKSGILLGCFFN